VQSMQREADTYMHLLGRWTYITDEWDNLSDRPPTQPSQVTSISISEPILVNPLAVHISNYLTLCSPLAKPIYLTLT
jgi:hypothetical protein